MKNCVKIYEDKVIVSFLSPGSSNIKGFYYNKENGYLVIEFNSGGVYKYFGVHPRIVVDMSKSDSVGRYFYKNIRSNPLIKYKKVS